MHLFEANQFCDEPLRFCRFLDIRRSQEQLSKFDMIIRDVKSNNAGKCAKLWYLLYLTSNFTPNISINIREIQILEHIHIELKRIVSDI
jgi:hypothetical protein